MAKLVISWIILVMCGIVYSQENMKNIWTGWSNWSPCSFTCSQGVRSRQRECVGVKNNRLVRIDNPRCPGDGVEHMICSARKCPSNQPSPRDAQCSSHNTQIESGEEQEWVPVNGGRTRCELTCIENSTNSYNNFGPVIDGTPCYNYDESNDICVDGRCVRAGCDGVIGSGKVLDWCKMCGGNNANCTIVRDSFKEKRPNKYNFDYKLIVKIPAGATYIEVTDTGGNYLALADSREKYLINGDWMIDSPGEYAYAGTIIMYERTQFNETIKAEGPTTEDLYIMLIFRVSNPGINFKFFIPTDKYEDVVIPKYKKHSKLNKHAMYGAEKPIFKKHTSTKKDDDIHENIIEEVKSDKLHHSSHGREHYESSTHDHKKTNQENNILAETKTTHDNSIQKKHNKNDYNENYVKKHDTKSLPGETIFRRYEQVGVSSDLLDQLEDHKGFSSYIKKDGTRGVQGDVNVKTTVVPQQSYISAEELYDSSEDDTNEDHIVQQAGQRPNYVHAPVDVFTSNKYTNIFGGTHCPSCNNYQPQIDYYCDSDFVLHGKIRRIDRIDGNTRFEVHIIKAYKDLFTLMTNEYIWTTGLCPCPELKENKEYVIMGRLVPHLKTRESRLQIDRRGYVKRYSNKQTARLRHMEQLCERRF